MISFLYLSCAIIARDIMHSIGEILKSESPIIVVLALNQAPSSVGITICTPLITPTCL